MPGKLQMEGCLISILPLAFIWGIRLSVILFVIFSFEGGLMASPLSHNVGAPDGGPGLPIVNWSKQYGDLRVGWAGNY